MRETLREKRGSGGFTLVELLITIVIVGILATVVVLAIGGLTNTGQKSACIATKDAAHAAAIAYRSDTGAWPSNFTPQLDNYLTPRAGVTVTGTSMANGTQWTLNFGAVDAADGPAFTGCPA